MATQKKQDMVRSLTDKVSQSKSIIFADYKGIKHKQLEELRKALHAAEAEIVVTKNRLMLRALGDTGKELEQTLTSETATLFNYGDEVAGLKLLTKFLKEVNLGKTKGGLLGKKVLSEKEVLTLATIPAKEVLLGNLVGQMQAPIRGLHYSLSWNLNKLVWALNGIKEKKSS